jgi:hypothetical protein
MRTGSASVCCDCHAACDSDGCPMCGGIRPMLSAALTHTLQAHADGLGWVDVAHYPAEQPALDARRGLLADDSDWLAGGTRAARVVPYAARRA